MAGDQIVDLQAILDGADAILERRGRHGVLPLLSGMLPCGSGCATVSASGRLPLPRPPPIGEDRMRSIVAGRAGDAAAGMRAGAAMVEAGQGPTVIGVTQHGPRPEQLVERHRPV